MLELAVKNDEDDLRRYREDMRSAPHTCPVCGLKKMMTIGEIEDHNDICLWKKKR